MRIVVDLPAPFGPTKPVMRPAASSNDRSSTTVRRPYDFVRWETRDHEVLLVLRWM